MGIFSGHCQELTIYLAQVYWFFTASGSLSLPGKHKLSGEPVHALSAQDKAYQFVSGKGAISLAETHFINLPSVLLRKVNGQRENMPRNTMKVKTLIMSCDVSLTPGLRYHSQCGVTKLLMMKANIWLLSLNI